MWAIILKYREEIIFHGFAWLLLEEVRDDLMDLGQDGNCGVEGLHLGHENKWLGHRRLLD